MSNYPYAYNTVPSTIENGIQFSFVSRGEFNIIKAVLYTYVFDHEGQRVYNLAFGDYDFRTNTLVDDQLSNNSDTYRVFNTVLSTVPHFFSTYPDAMMMVWGSDSTKEYQETCHLSCKKNCAPDVCKNAHRRINIYRSYVNKNLIELSLNYKFYGASINIENQLNIEEYKKFHLYPSIILKKNKK